MSDRISIKGKGASIFFGEETGAAHLPEQSADQPDDALVRSHPGTEASRHAGAGAPGSEPTREPASGPQIGHPNEPTFFEALVLPASLRRKLRAISREEHPFHTSVRLNRGEMVALRDLCYELEAKMGIVVNRNDVARLALRLLLEDYALRQKESLLVQVLKEEDQY